MNILFLSDLHFGRESVSDDCKQRETIQESLIQTLIDLPENMKPHYVVVTGDIAWTGAEDEYDSAYIWFSRLLSQLGYEGDRITFCVGNHDVNRRVAVGIPFVIPFAVAFPGGISNGAVGIDHKMTVVFAVP